MRVRPLRSGYTLLEVVLALAIGVLLMAALYTALNMTLRHAQAGREKVEQSTLARSLLARISNDIATNISPPKPAQSGGSSGQGGGGGGSGQSGSAASGGTSQGGSGSGSAPSSGASAVQGLGGTIVFNQGIQGDSSTLILYASRVPTELDPAWVGDAAPTVSDLRRIAFWLSPSGLCRQEIKLATSDDAINSLPTDLPDDPSFVIAEEVKSLTFQYWDGSAWQDSWDGTQTPSAGGNNPQGPPLAIAITIGLVIPGSSTESGDPVVKTFHQVVPIAAANGATQNSGSSTTASGSGTGQ